jgi:acyl transferase domain-containing protein
VSGEIDGAIVGGTNLIQAVENHLGTQEMGVLSPTSTCHTFDAAADGYGRGEGIGAIYLKRLSSAVRDGDPIRGVIRATATNANGRTSGVSHPSVAGQEAVIRAAYNFAGITDFGETSYFETHVRCMVNHENRTLC